MKYLYKLIAAFAFVITISGKSFAQDTIPMSFQEAVQMGLSQNIDYLKLLNQQEVLKVERLNAQLNHLPRLNLTNDNFRQIGQQFQQVEGELIVTNEINNIVSGRINANMPIFNGLRRTSETRAGKDWEDAGKFGLERARQEVMFNIAQQYLQVLLDEELYNIAVENLDNQKKQLEQIEGFVEAGLRTLSDLYNQRSEVARLETVAIDAKIQWESDLWELAETLQLGPNILPLPEQVALEKFESEWLNMPLNELYDVALEQRKDYGQQMYLERANKNLLASAKSAYMPQLNVFFNYSTFFTTLDDRTFRNQFFTIFPQRSFGFSLTVPIFNNFDNRAAVVRARVEFQNQQLDKSALERRISQEVKLAFENFKGAIRREEATRLQLEAAVEAQTVISERFRLGVSNFVDLSQANQQLVTAQSDHAQAQYSLFFQDLMLKFALGILEVAKN
ncbi:TolC family protein [Cecembia sp.]|uniref:TolC family protein n=1 Tax=Cecembia sp. TaxID=1898110 RepID=UPI0025C06B19|nr:TolC family protein [Cecembia sp.]